MSAPLPLRPSAPRRTLLLTLAFLAAACARDPLAAAEVPPPKADLPAPADGKPQTAVLAMGCFWCAEGVFERIDGVSEVVSGYAGGTADTADYEMVSDGKTGHAESIRITYDPKKISYGKLLQIFFTTHDPTTKDRQGPDWGHQYRSAIFVETPAQRSVAEQYIKQLSDAKVFTAPVVTTVEPLPGFYRAEAYHQDYVKNHPDHPYVRMWFPAKEKKLREHFAAQLKKEYRGKN